MATLRTILYVEDEADIRMVATMALQSVGGFEVHACANGAEALKAVEALHPDLLLLDVMMPGMDGPSTLAALRATPQAGATPAIFMTAKVQASEVAHYRALGAIGVVPKPFDPMELPEQIRRLWADNAKGG